MNRPLALTAVAFALGLGIAAFLATRPSDGPAASAPSAASTPDGEAARGPGRRHGARRSGEEAGPEDGSEPSNSPADPPPERVAVVAPTPLDAPLPEVSAVPAPEGPVNVVMVLGCTVRKDQVTPYGGHPEATPFLASLAERGTLFDDTLAAAPWTRAASTAILTGRHAVHLGMVEPGPSRNNKRLPDAVTTVAERFAAAGYLTLGGTANPNLGEPFGFHQGYDLYQPGLPTSWANKLTGSDLADKLLDALDRRRAEGDDRPLFLRVMMLDAHSPRDAPSSAYDRYALPGEPDRIAQYRAHLHAFDEGVEQLFQGLAARGLDRSNTVFVVVADHGEGMNYPKHHGYAHGQYHTPSTNHVPWILAGAGVAEGHRILGTASQVDVTPTVLDLAGLDADDDRFDGLSHAALVRGQGHVIDRPRVFSDTWFQQSNRAAVFTPTLQCQDDFGSSARQRRKGKFVPGCYDRHADPLLTRPLEAPELMEALHAWRARATAVLEGTTVDAIDVDASLNDQLEALGYVE